MAQENHFLTIPKQEGLFTTIKCGRAGETRDDSPVDDDDEEEETEEEVRFIPRCSPVPRKRGPSITDETAEYMRIRLALQRRVSFADATGAELVDVREFAAFDSEDEEDNNNWEEEEARCRRAYLEPSYRVWPEFQARAGNDLTLAVRANKVEVEKVTAVQDEPLSFDALICVLNVSYHKCVYVRSTMDGWNTHTDTQAEYVQGSHDGDTDKFSVRLTFAEPYLFNGARIDFVVRYETSHGDFWANNSGRNYSVTLVVSYEEDTEPVIQVDDREIKGILKPPRYRAEDDLDFCEDTDNGDVDNAECEAAAETPSSVGPLVIEPEIDIEIPAALISPSETREDSTITQCPLLRTDRQEDLQDLSEHAPQTDHVEKGQGTELLIPTENNTVSVQSGAPLIDIHFVYSPMFNQHFCPNQDNPQSDTTVQSPAMFPSIQDTGKDDFREGQNNETQSEESEVAQLQDQTSDTVEADTTESSLHELQESTEQCSIKELTTANAGKGEGDFSYSSGHDIIFEESHESLLENPEMQIIKPNTVVRRETSGKEQTGLMQGEVQDIIPSCMWQPIEPTGLGQTTEDSMIQHVPSPLGTPEVTEYQQKGQGPELELNKVPEDLSVNVATSSGSEITVAKEEIPMLISLSSAIATSQSLTTTVQTVAPEGLVYEPLLRSEEDKFDLASCQKPEGLESQSALPCKALEASNVEVDMILSKTLIPSFAFLSATVCLLVGFYEPSIFLIMALFLVSLCF